MVRVVGVLLLAVGGCFCSHTRGDEDPARDGGRDAALGVDAGPTVDAGPELACSEALAGDSVPWGSRCDPATFGECVRYEEEGACCGVEVLCEDGTITPGTRTCMPDCPDVSMACPRWEPEEGSGAACTVRSDCPLGGVEECVIPGEGPCAGGPLRTCASDTDCPDGVLCQPHPSVCGVGSQCAPPCEAGDCHEGFECVEDGHCAAVSCTDGWTCPSSATCSPGDPDANAHGCVRRPCTTHADCDCGFCVAGMCADGPGVCVCPGECV